MNADGEGAEMGENTPPRSPDMDFEPIIRVLRMKPVNVHPEFLMVVPPAMYPLLPGRNTRCRLHVGDKSFKMDYVVRGALRKFKKRHWTRFVKKCYVEAEDELEMEFVGGVTGGEVFDINVRVVHHVSDSPDLGSISGSNSDNEGSGFFH